MIAANGVAARFLASRQFPSIRRVVQHAQALRDRIVEIAVGSRIQPPGPSEMPRLWRDFLDPGKSCQIRRRFPDSAPWW